MKECEERLQQSQADMRRQLEIQAVLLEKSKKDLDDVRAEAEDAQRGAITMFNEQKRYESHSALTIQCSSSKQCSGKDEDRGSGTEVQKPRLA